MSRAIGQVSTSSASTVPVSSTTYTEQTTGSQMSLVSASGSDAPSGSGALTVKVTYYELSSTGGVTGPFTETVTLNGETAVNTVGTALCLIEKMEVTSAGSGGAAAGAITLYNGPGGSSGNSAVGSIASGDTTTRFGHHYVPSNRACKVTDVIAVGGYTTAAVVSLVKTPLASAYAPSDELPHTVLGSSSTTPAALPLGDGGLVPGPARLRLLVTPTSNSQTTYASFGFVDVPSVSY